MPDPFEDKLSAMFAEPSEFADEASFAARVETRLSRDVWIRRAWLGAAGVAGAAIAIGQGVAGGLDTWLAENGAGLMGEATAVVTNADGLTIPTPHIAGAAIAISIVALFAIGVRAARA